MILKYVFSIIIVILLKNNFKTVYANLHNYNTLELGEREKLLKVLRCQEYLTKHLRGNQGFLPPECEELLTPTLDHLREDRLVKELKNIVNLLGVKTGEDFYANVEKLKKLLNVVEVQRKDIELLYTLVDALKNNKPVLLVNCDGENNNFNLSGTLTDLKNNIGFLQNNQEFIESRFTNLGKKEFFNIKELEELSAELDNINDGLKRWNCSGGRFKLGDIFGADKNLKTTFKDLFRGKKLKDDPTKKDPFDNGKDLLDNGIDQLIEKGKEVQKKVLDAKNLIENSKLDDALGKVVVDQLDNLRVKLNSHESVLFFMKDMFLGELKDTVLQELYNIYVNYRKKRAIKRGEPIPTFSEKYDIAELRKGLIEFGVRSIFKKIAALLRFIKEKIFRRRSAVIQRDQLVHDERLLKKDINQLLPRDFTENTTDPKNDPFLDDVNDNYVPQELNATGYGDETFILSNINNLLEELDLYEDKFRLIEEKFANQEGEGFDNYLNKRDYFNDDKFFDRAKDLDFTPTPRETLDKLKKDEGLDKKLDPECTDKKKKLDPECTDKKKKKKTDGLLLKIRKKKE